MFTSPGITDMVCQISLVFHFHFLKDFRSASMMRCLVMLCDSKALQIPKQVQVLFHSKFFSKCKKGFATRSRSIYAAYRRHFTSTYYLQRGSF